MLPRAIHNAEPAAIQMALFRLAKGCSLEVAACLAWTLLVGLKVAFWCQFGIKVASVCGISICEPVSGSDGHCERCDVLALFMLFNSAVNGVAREPKGVAKRMAEIAERPLRGFARGCWISLPLPREAAEKELFRSGRSPPWGA